MKIKISENELRERLLNETPDQVRNLENNLKYSEGYLLASWDDDDAIGFGFLNNSAFITYNDRMFFASNNISKEKKDIIGRLKHSVIEELRVHGGIGNFYGLLNEPNNIGTKRENFEYPGRIWLDSKIISFWVYPNKNDLIKLLNILKKEIQKIYGIVVDLTDYMIEVKDDSNIDTYDNTVKHKNLTTIKDFISSTDATEQELQAIHTLPSVEKRNTSQMKAARNADVIRLANKFSGETSQVEWNAAKNKYRGESKTFKINQAQLSILKESFDIQSKVDEQHFTKEVKLFLYNLISNDTHEQIPSRFWQLNGYKKHEVINLLNKFNIIAKDDSGFKVPKSNFERKVGRLYSYLFPDNQQPIVEDGEGGGDIGGGNSCSSVGGSYEVPFSGVIRRNIGTF